MGTESKLPYAQVNPANVYAAHEECLHPQVRTEKEKRNQTECSSFI